jgi:hypothetical protein
VGEAILAIADERARRASFPPIRWVDDVVFAGDRDAVRRASVAWTRALHEVGLRENESKRRTFAPGTLERVAAIGAPSIAGHIRRGIIRTS